MRQCFIVLIAAAWYLPGCAPASYLQPPTPEAPKTSLCQDLKEVVNSEPCATADYSKSPHAIGNVTTVASPEYPPRKVSLAECLALALENGRTGEYFDLAGSERRTSVTGSGRAILPADASDSIRVFAFDPALLATETEQSLARFDPIWTTDFNWMRTNRLSQELNPLPSDELILKNQLDTVGFNSTLLKPLPTGGVAGLFFSDNYSFLPQLSSSQFVNPGYQPLTGLIFEQPLLRGAGVPINQILDSHPGGYRNVFPISSRMPGIMLTRIGQAKSQLEFERRVQELVFKVEEAYWGLYSAYWELFSRENGMRQAHRAWLSAKNKQAAGGLGEADVAMIEEQYHFFRTQRLEAMGRGVAGRAGVLEAERRLRYVLGLPAEDGTRLVPEDSPGIVPFDTDWHRGWQDATMYRPELRQIHEDLKGAELAIARATDQLKPDLRVYSKYDVNGLGNDFGSSFQNLFQDGRSEWELGVRLQIPIGFREGHAELTRARLQLAQRLALLRDQEEKLVFSLQRSYRDLVQFREEIQTRRSQRAAAERQLQARLQKWNAGGAESIDLILRAQRNWVDALRDEQAAICNYRVALADYERQKGTILRAHAIVITDGHLPSCVKPNASLQIHDWLRKTPPLAVLLAPVAAGDSPPAPENDIFAMPPFDPSRLLKSVTGLDK
jgi:outer membrane protein TolC